MQRVQKRRDGHQQQADHRRANQVQKSTTVRHHVCRASVDSLATERFQNYVDVNVDGTIECVLCTARLEAITKAWSVIIK